MSARSPAVTPTTSTTFLPGTSSAPLFPSSADDRDPLTTPTASSFSPRVPIPAALRKGQLVHHDNDCLVFREEERAFSSKGHLSFLVQPPLASIYDFSPASVPLLARLHALAQTLLAEHFPSSYPGGNSSSSSASRTIRPDEKIGFVSSPFKDPLNAGHPNLTLHAIIGPLDKAGFYTRSFPLGPLGWYGIEDLIAEIRESSSNNRVRSAHPPSATSSGPRPLATALDAGSRAGLPNGLEITPSGELISHPTPSDPPLPPRRTQRLDSLTSASSAGSSTHSGSGLVGQQERVIMGDVPEGSKRRERGKGKETEVSLGEEIDLGELAKRDVEQAEQTLV